MRQTLVGVLERIVVKNCSPWAGPCSTHYQVDLFLELDRPEGEPPSPWFHASVDCDYLIAVFAWISRPGVVARRARAGDRVEILGEWGVCYCADGRGNVGPARVFYARRLRVIERSGAQQVAAAG